MILSGHLKTVVVTQIIIAKQPGARTTRHRRGPCHITAPRHAGARCFVLSHRQPRPFTETGVRFENLSVICYILHMHTIHIGAFGSCVSGYMPGNHKFSFPSYSVSRVFPRVTGDAPPFPSNIHLGFIGVSEKDFFSETGLLTIKQEINYDKTIFLQ